MDLKAGEWEFLGHLDDPRAGIRYACPCCGGAGALPFVKLGSSPTWNWDGDVEKPTLTPSILRRQTCGWHGFMVKGVLQVNSA